MRVTHVGVRAGLALCLLLLGPVPHDVDHPRSQARAVVDVRSQMGQHDESLERVGLPELLEALARKMVEELRGDEEEGDGGHDVEVDREELALELPERQSSCGRLKRERWSACCTVSEDDEESRKEKRTDGLERVYSDDSVPDVDAKREGPEDGVQGLEVEYGAERGQVDRGRVRHRRRSRRRGRSTFGDRSDFHPQTPMS